MSRLGEYLLEQANGIWWVGYNLVVGNKSTDIRGVLKERADDARLYGVKEPNAPHYSGEDIVFMIAR